MILTGFGEVQWWAVENAALKPMLPYITRIFLGVQ
jgi:hypothetical protein